MKQIYIQTFGCQMNISDSETILSSMTPHGYQQTETLETADLIVINTCSIREKAEQKLRSYVGRLKPIKEHSPHLRIAIAGCMAQRVGKELLRSMPIIDIVMGPDQVRDLPELLEARDYSGKPIVRTEFEPEDTQFNLDHRTYRDKSSGFVPIMKGCDHKCTYCIVPFTRGTEKSRPLDSILEEVGFLIHRKGLKEITLVGQNVNGYGRGTAFDFPKLLWRLAQIPRLHRLRFITSHPKDANQDLANCFRDIPVVSPYLHLPIQSGSNAVLKRMKRLYTHEEYRDSIAMFRTAQPRLAFSTDIIVGFPGETDEDFQDTLKLVEDIQFDFAYSFIYSERPNTPATRLKDDIPLDVKKKRLFLLQKKLQESANAKSLKLVGTEQELLVEKSYEKDGAFYVEGRTDTFKISRIATDRSYAYHDLMRAKITSTYETTLLGSDLTLETHPTHQSTIHTHASL
jgi:tRNA-2-methylthio-N6-dimethylallyladenosine synthase